MAATNGIFRYCFTLELAQRLRALGHRLRILPLGIALMLVATGLLPKSYLATTPQDRLKVSSILAAAADRIRWRRDDIDRILIFAAIILALIVLALQTLIILITAFVSDAHAASIFSLTPEAARQDIVLVFLDHIFGVSGVFNSGATAVGTPLHQAIHALLGFYSQAMMIIATLIVVYYVVIVVGESAQTGTPFGKRFNGLWAPLRLVLALGLLVPLGSGLNAAQYATLYVAKFGSAFASNAWAVFAAKATDPTGLVTAPEVRATRALVKNVFVAEVCKQAFEVQQPPPPPIIEAVNRVLSFETRSVPADLSNPAGLIKQAREAGQTRVAIAWVWGQPGPPVTENTCGRVAIDLAPALRQSQGTLGRSLTDAVSPLTEAYVGEVGRIITDLGDAPRQFASIYVSYLGNTLYGNTAILDQLDATLDQAGRRSTERVRVAVARAHAQIARNGTGRELLDRMTKQGWAGAGIWYVSIGQLNQKFQQAVRAGEPLFTDTVSGAPRESLTHATDKESAVKSAITQAESFALRLDPVVPPGNPNVRTDAGSVEDPESMVEALKDRPIETILDFVFKTDRLRLLRTNPTLDPMVVLVSAGDRMILQSMAAFTLGISAKVVGETVSDSWFTQIPFLGTAAKLAAKTLAAFGSFFVATALIGFMAGVILFYALPIFPFLYFFFSIVGWGLSIVEALVAAPLWALAHLRIDGDGLPGQGAAGGYFMLFEIMLRPILIVAGLIIGYTVFGAGAYLLSTVFDFVTNAIDVSMETSFLDTAPTTDRGASSGMDNFIYTIIFTIIVYGMALSCFKLSDNLPNGVMRWLGAPQGASPFSGGKDTPDMQGTLLAGGAAVHTLASGLQQSLEKVGRSKKDQTPKDQTPGSAPGYGGGGGGQQDKK